MQALVGLIRCCGREPEVELPVAPPLRLGPYLAGFLTADLTLDLPEELDDGRVSNDRKI